MEVKVRARTIPWCHAAGGARSVFGRVPAVEVIVSACPRVGHDRHVNELKERLRSDLTAAMRARDQVRLRTLRMALTSITNEEVSGNAVHDLSDEEIVKVLTREAKKRREAAEAFEAAGRAEQAEAERAEGDVLSAYLPAQLSDDDLASLVAAAISETGAAGLPGLGKVMKAVTPQI